MEKLRLKLSGSDEIIEIPRGDLDDETWASLKAKAVNDKTERGVPAEDREFLDKNRRILEGERVKDDEFIERGRRATERDSATRPRGDYLELNLGGHKAYVPRGDIDDTEWARLKEDARKNGTFSSSVDTNPPPAEPKIDLEVGPPRDIIRGPDLLNESFRAGPVRVERRLEKAPFGQNADELEETGDEPRMGSGGGGGLGPMGFFRRAVAQTALGASPDGGVADQDAGASPAFSNVRMPPPYDTSTPPGAAQAAARQQLEAQGGQYTPPSMTAPGPGQFTELDVRRLASSGQGQFADPAALVQGTPVPPEQVRMMPPESMGQSVGVSMRASGGGVGLGPSAAAGMDKRIEEDYRNQAKAIERAAELESKRMAKAGELQNQAIQQRLDGQIIEHDIQVRRQQEQDAARDGIKDVQRRIAEVQQVDPNRLWNNMGTGAKVLGGIAIALGGLQQAHLAALGVNAGNDNLEMFRDAVKRDIAIQQTNIENRRSALGAELEGQREVYNMLRQAGLDEITAFRAEESLKYDMIIQQADSLAKQIGTPEAQAKAQVLIAGLAGDRDKAMMAVFDSIDRNAMERARLSMQNRELGMRMSLVQAKGQKVEPLRGAQIMQLAEGQTAFSSLKELNTAFKDVSGVHQKLLANLPLMATDAKKYNAQRDLALRKVAKFIDQSVLQKHDIETWDDLFPRAGDTNGATKLQVLKQMLQESYENQVRGFQSSGYSVGSSFTNEEDPDMDF